MIYLLAALAAVSVAFACQAAALTRLLTTERRAHQRERDALLNKLLHAVGKPWESAPADDPKPVVERDPGPPRFTAHPERYLEA